MSDEDQKKSEAERQLTLGRDVDSQSKLTAPKRIVLRKTIEGGTVKQAFSHGRTRSVAVEVRKKRTFVSRTDPGGREQPDDEGGDENEQQDEAARSTGKPHVLRSMSAEEREAFLKSQKEEQLQRRQDEERRNREAAELKAKEEAEQRRLAEIARLEEEARRKQEELRKALEEEARKKDDKKDDKKKDKKAKKDKKDKGDDEPVTVEIDGAVVAVVAENEAMLEEVVASTDRSVAEAQTEEPMVEEEESILAVNTSELAAVISEEESDLKKKKPLTRAQKEEIARRKSEDLVAQRLAQIAQLRELKRKADVEVEKRRTTLEANTTASRKEKKTGKRVEKVRGGRGRRGAPVHVAMPTAPIVREVVIPEVINVGELASRMAVKSAEVVKVLFKMGNMVTINESLDQDTAVLVVEEMGHRAKPVSEAASIVAELAEGEDSDEDLVTRPPVVTIMGHVDHGKTSLLDAIRETDVTSREHGGITQHIGAYQVRLANDARITFLDTPGHEAFTSMRARGAQATDLVVLVVAADDGVMPQTVEAISHAKAAKVPILVAINKMDKPGADPEQVMQQLTTYEMVPEEWGGDTIYVRVSAKTGEGLEQLQEMILLQAEMLDLKSNPGKEARGVIVEAKLDRGRGALATCLVQNGTLNQGDICVVGSHWGRIRELRNDKGKGVRRALPSMPVEIVGLSGVPQAGDELVVVPGERRARDIALFRERKDKELQQAKRAQSNFSDIFSQLASGEQKELKVVLKGDVQGSVEAVRDALLKIAHEEIRVSVVHAAVGGINESDVRLAMASGALIVGFNVRADAKGRELADQEGIDLRFHNVIYDLVDEVKMALEGMLNPVVKEDILGRAEIRQVFRIAKLGNIGGCMVVEGTIPAKGKVRLVRDSVVIHEGVISSLKRFQDDASQAREGDECGISLERFHDLKEGDIIEAFTRKEVRQTLE